MGFVLIGSWALCKSRRIYGQPLTFFTLFPVSDVTLKMTNNTTIYLATTTLQYLLNSTTFNNTLNSTTFNKTLNSANTTKRPPVRMGPCELRYPDYIQLFVYTLVMILGIFGNASICYCFGLFHKTARKTVSEVLILYLAVVDFCASIFTPFVFIYWIATCYGQWHFGTLGCKVLPFLGRVFINISVGIICILALDRYRAICSPFKGQFKKKYIHISVGLAVILAVLCEVYYLDALTYHVKPLPYGSVGCLVTPSNRLKYIKITTSILLARDIFFVFIFTYTTTKIVLCLRKRNTYCPTDPEHMSNSRRETEHVIRVIIVMQIMFICLVLPRDLLHIIFSLSWVDGNGIPYSKAMVRWNDALKVIQTANCCANVFIYAKMHGRFRKTVKSLIQHSVSCFSPNRPKEHRLSHKEIIKNAGMTNFNNNSKPYERKLLKPKALIIYSDENSSNNSFVTGETTIYEMIESPALSRTSTVSKIPTKNDFLLPNNQARKY